MNKDQHHQFDVPTYVAGILGGIGAGFLVASGLCSQEQPLTVPVAIVGFAFVATGSLLAYSRRRKVRSTVIRENSKA